MVFSFQEYTSLPGQGLFENDRDYRERVQREAAEQRIASSTGSKPSQGWFESDDNYQNRVIREAAETTIKDSSDSAPCQGLFESDRAYQVRVIREAAESTIREATQSSPSQGLFESDGAYERRVSKEADEFIVRTSTGSTPSRRLFESDTAYRKRVNIEANEIVSRNAKNIPGAKDYRKDNQSSCSHHSHHGISIFSSRGKLSIFFVIFFATFLFLVVVYFSYKVSEQNASHPVFSSAELVGSLPRVRTRLASMQSTDDKNSYIFDVDLSKSSMCSNAVPGDMVSIDNLGFFRRSPSVFWVSIIKTIKLDISGDGDIEKIVIFDCGSNGSTVYAHIIDEKNAAYQIRVGLRGSSVRFVNREIIVTQPTGFPLASPSHLTTSHYAYYKGLLYKTRSDLVEPFPENFAPRW